MQKLQNYIILEKITETRSSIIYCGHKDTSEDRVIIKALKTKNPTPSEIARFRQDVRLLEKRAFYLLFRYYRPNKQIK